MIDAIMARHMCCWVLCVFMVMHIFDTLNALVRRCDMVVIVYRLRHMLTMMNAAQTRGCVVLFSFFAYATPFFIAGVFTIFSLLVIQSQICIAAIAVAPAI